MTDTTPSAPVAPTYAPGWYPDGAGLIRYHDGHAWTQHVQSPPPVAAPAMRQARDGSGYMRPMQAHSLTKWVLASLFLVLPVIGLVYFSVSPNHYWHA